MITAQVEPFMANLEELKPLLPLHYEELAQNKDKVPLDPNWDEYGAMENSGKLLYVTVRKAGELIGYFVGAIGFDLNYRTCLSLRMIVFYTTPAHRDGSPTAALKLFREVIREAKRRGVMRWYAGSKVHQDASRLFEHLGLTKIETYYSQWIGD